MIASCSSRPSLWIALALGHCLSVPLALLMASCAERASEPVAASFPRRPAGEETAEPLYRAALAAAHEEPELVLDRLEAALRAGACPTRALSESAFGRLHAQARFRALIRAHAHQSVTVMVLPEEPGTRLAVSGTVRDGQGRPLANALVYAFQTDARGIYSPQGEGAPRIFGYVRTAPDGTYGFHTIRPGPYPDEVEPIEQHIHFEITGPGGESVIARLGFEDDPHWEGRRVPRWAVPVERDAQGGERCRLDVVVK